MGNFAIRRDVSRGRRGNCRLRQCECVEHSSLVCRVEELLFWIHSKFQRFECRRELVMEEVDLQLVWFEVNGLKGRFSRRILQRYRRAWYRRRHDFANIL